MYIKSVVESNDVLKPRRVSAPIISSGNNVNAKAYASVNLPAKRGPTESSKLPNKNAEDIISNEKQVYLV